MKQGLIHLLSFFPLILIILFSTPCIAQKQLPDTLKTAYFFNKKYRKLLKNKSDSIVNYYESSIAKSITNKDTLTQLYSLINLAEFHELISNDSKCLDYLSQAENLITKSEFDRDKAIYRINYAYAKSYFGIQDYWSTIKYCQKALNTYFNSSDQNNDKLNTIYYYLSNSYLRIQSFDSSLIYISKSDSLLEFITANKKWYQLNNIQKKAQIEEEMGYRREALNSLLNGLEVIDEDKNTDKLADFYVDIAHNYYSLRELDKSVQYYDQAIKVHESLNSPIYPDITNIYTAKARVYTLMGNSEKALQLLKTGIEHRIQHGNFGLISVYQTIANTYMTIDSLEMADAYLKESLKILNDLDLQKESYKYANAIFYYGHFLIERMHETKGIELTEEALSIYKKKFGAKHPTIADCYNYLGKAQLLIFNNPDKALQYLQKSLMANNLTFYNDDIYTNPNIENTLNKKYLLTILIDKAAALSEKIKQESITKINIADIDLMNNTLLLAINTIDYIRTSFTSVDSKLKMNEKTETLYSELISSTLILYQITNDQKYLLKAYEYAGNSKTAILNSLMDEDRAKITAGVPPEILQQEKALRIKKGKLNNKLNNLEIVKSNDQTVKDRIADELFITDQKIDLLTANLENKYQKYHQLKYKNESLSVEQLQSHLTKNQVVLEYFITDSVLINFIVSKNSFEIKRSNIDTSFFSNIYRLSSIFKSNSYTQFNKEQFKAFKHKSHDLYLKLIDPIKEEIADRELIIIPDKELLQLPFEVLLTNDAKNVTKYRNLPYMINKYPISYSYSSEWLFSDHKRARAKNGLLAIVPSYDKEVDYDKLIRIENERTERDVLAPIPAALNEAKNIIQSIGGDILEADDATEAKFKNIAKDYSILHFAMHTVIDDYNPMFSKLVFTPGIIDSTNKEDNLLNTYEVFNMDLNAQMVVLSSCKSGYGTLQKGEGIMSMARGFIFAGCPSLAITLWSIDDVASADLMSLYYQNLAEGMNKANALQKAKIEFLETADPIRVHPHFWASHILIGDTSELNNNKTRILIYFGFAFILIILIWIILKKKPTRLLKESLQPDHDKTHFA